MSLTLAEARARAALVSEVAYEIALDLTGDGPTYGCRTTIRFHASGPETFLELTNATDLRLVVNGVAVAEPAYDGRRIALAGLAGATEVAVEARVPYVTDGDGMHTMTDPADGQRYVGAYCGMDISQKVFPCFDQNDLKASMELTVTADPAWTVLANGRTLESADGRWRFSPTLPVPPALFVVAAGPWASVRWEHAGLPFGWHARASLAAELDRDDDELRAITEACFDHFATLFDEPYPFDSYDQVLVPGLNWGAQEMPGCVTYRDEYLPRGAVPEHLRFFRAAVIAHEMSHMWFGDLVTMTWWEDTWLQESFADYMGYRVAADGAGFAGALLGHEVDRKPNAYDADERRSTHPVAPRPEDVPDVDSAATIFDAISYSKGNSVLRQLVTWLGDETFLRGVNTYLTRHRFGNTTLDDFVTALDEASDRDVRGWVEVWLRRTGFDTIRVDREDDGVPVLRREGMRPHRFRVTAYDDTAREVGSEMVDLADEPVRLPAYTGLTVVPNSHGETFARTVLDEASAAAVSAGLCRVDDDLTRAVLWAVQLDRVQTGALGPEEYVDLVTRQLPGERSATIVSSVLTRTLGRVLPLRVPTATAGAALRELASACATGLEHAGGVELARAFASGFAATTDEPGPLADWLAAGSAGGLPLTPALRWQVVRRLARLGAMDEEAIRAEGAREPGVEARLGVASALAARPTADAKEEAWAVAADPGVDNRVFTSVMEGLWSAEQADLLASYVERYLREAPRWAARGQAFAQVVGRARPALMLTAGQVDLLREALGGDVPTVLRRQWEDWCDDLGRASEPDDGGRAATAAEPARP